VAPGKRAIGGRGKRLREDGVAKQWGRNSHPKKKEGGRLSRIKPGESLTKKGLLKWRGILVKKGKVLPSPEGRRGLLKWGKEGGEILQGGVGGSFERTDKEKFKP